MAKHGVRAGRHPARMPARECPRSYFGTRGGGWGRGTEVTAARCGLGSSVRRIALRTFLRRYYRGCACRVSRNGGMTRTRPRLSSTPRHRDMRSLMGGYPASERTRIARNRSAEGAQKPQVGYIVAPLDGRVRARRDAWDACGGGAGDFGCMGGRSGRGV